MNITTSLLEHRKQRLAWL